METRRIKLTDLVLNEGQVTGLPTNPRQWTRAELENLKKSLQETPELLEARGILVYPWEGKYLVLGGNMRLSALKALKAKDAPCIVFPEDTPIDKLKEVVIKDNGSFGEWDYDLLANEWDSLPLADWGVPNWERDLGDSLLQPMQRMMTLMKVKSQRVSAALVICGSWEGIVFFVVIQLTRRTLKGLWEENSQTCGLPTLLTMSDMKARLPTS